MIWVMRTHPSLGPSHPASKEKFVDRIEEFVMVHLIGVHVLHCTESMYDIACNNLLFWQLRLNSRSRIHRRRRNSSSGRSCRSRRSRRRVCLRSWSRCNRRLRYRSSRCSRRGAFRSLLDRRTFGSVSFAPGICYRSRKKTMRFSEIASKMSYTQYWHGAKGWSDEEKLFYIGCKDTVQIYNQRSCLNPLKPT
jgi:hypothetical protein